jgi:transcriptional regulator with XRE-family HTH domain
MILSPDEWVEKLGQQVRDLRIRADLTQEELARRSGIGLSALKALEGGKGGKIRNLVVILEHLGRLGWLDALSPPVSVSPMQVLKSASKTPRQRASPKRKAADGDVPRG